MYGRTSKITTVEVFRSSQLLNLFFISFLLLVCCCYYCADVICFSFYHCHFHPKKHLFIHEVWCLNWELVFSSFWMISLWYQNTSDSSSNLLLRMWGTINNQHSHRIQSIMKLLGMITVIIVFIRRRLGSFFCSKWNKIHNIFHEKFMSYIWVLSKVYWKPPYILSHYRALNSPLKLT